MTEKSGVTGKTVIQLARTISAKDREAARAQRSSEEQLALLDTRPGKSQKERARLAG